MAGTLDLSKLTFCGEIVQLLSELIFDEVARDSEIQAFHTIYPNIVTKREVGRIGSGGLVGTAGMGCNPVATNWKIPVRKYTFTPHEWEVYLSMCYTDLEDTVAVYSLRTGVDIGDFTDTDYMNIVIEALSKAMKSFWWRLHWFNDVSAKNVSDGGTITDGIELKYFNILDGFWKQITEQAVAVSKQRVTITENTGASYTAQDIEPAAAKEYLKELYYKAPLVLREQNDGFMLVTQSIYDAYAQNFQDACCLESSRIALLNGMKVLSMSGIPVVPIHEWDTIIHNYEDTGTKWNNPNRAIYTTKSVLAVGMDNPNAFDEFKTWYNQDEEKVKTKAKGKADAVLANPDMFQVAI